MSAMMAAMATGKRGGWGPAGDYTLDAVAHAAQAERDAKDRLDEATAALADLLLRMHRLGATWQQLADAAGLANAENARWRAQHARPPGDLPKSLERVFNRPSSPLKAAQDADGEPGVTFVRAAEILGVSRQTVYNRVESGALRTRTDAAGRRWVLIDSEGAPLD